MSSWRKFARTAVRPITQPVVAMEVDNSQSTQVDRESDVETSDSPDRSKPMWELRLYVAGKTPKSVTALANLKSICENYMPGQYEIEIIDLIENPRLAIGDQILAVPTLVRKLPEPMRKIIGDLSNTERVLVGLDVRPID